VLAAGGPATAQPRLAGPTAAPGADPARLLAEGNQAYTEGQLDTARVRYQAALAAGADDAVVHYNLGNVFARQGQLGRAIASYLRAQRRAPRDADIRTNLQWVRSHTRDLELAGGGLPPVIAQLDAAAHRLTVDEWALAVVILAWLVAGLLAWWWRRGWLGAWPRRGVLAAGALLVLVAVVLATRWYEEQGRDTAVVVAEEVAVRSGPASSFPVVFRIHDGLTLTIRGTRDGWARIGLGGDWVGWVPGGTLERVRRPDPTAGQGR
jgi:tetratricopeptide (TPR) repeat protein